MTRSFPWPFAANMTSIASSPIFLMISSSPASNRLLVYEPGLGFVLRSSMVANTRARMSLTEVLQSAEQAAYRASRAARTRRFDLEQQHVAVTVGPDFDNLLGIAAGFALAPDDLAAA